MWVSGELDEIAHVAQRILASIKEGLRPDPKFGCALVRSVYIGLEPAKIAGQSVLDVFEIGCVSHRPSCIDRLGQILQLGGVGS